MIKPAFKQWMTILIVSFLYSTLMLLDDEFRLAGMAVVVAYAYLYGVDNALIPFAIGIITVSRSTPLTQNELSDMIVMTLFSTLVLGLIYDVVIWLKIPVFLEWMVHGMIAAYTGLILVGCCLVSNLILGASSFNDVPQAFAHTVVWSLAGLVAGKILDRWV